MFFTSFPRQSLPIASCSTLDLRYVDKSFGLAVKAWLWSRICTFWDIRLQLNWMSSSAEKLQQPGIRGSRASTTKCCDVSGCGEVREVCVTGCESALIDPILKAQGVSLHRYENYHTCWAYRWAVWSGSTPFPRTVELRVCAPVAGTPGATAAGDCASARCSQRYPLLPRLSSGTDAGSRVLV